MTDHSRLIAAQSLAQSALELADINALRPTPEVFSVIYHHLQGYNPPLVADVKAALDLPPDAREEAILGCYSTHLSQAPLQDGLERVHASLTNGLGATANCLNQGLSCSSKMSDDLRQCLRELAGSVTKADVQTVCKDMARSTRAHTGGTQEVVSELKHTQFQLEQMQQELAELRFAVSRDHLTGLPNRRHFEQHVNTLLERNVSFSLAVIDLDNFKKVNDLSGHLFGDNVLRALSQVLTENTKGKDFAARIGGEEFALTLPNTPLKGATKVCNQIREAFADILWLSETDDREVGSFTLSAGVCEFRPADTFVSMFQRADSALYRAKEGGRNRVVST